MGASRKLQGEIDRVLKKVQEGVDVFDSIWNKVYDTENANQKEKFEADLKKEIKKLQRYRDQIKTWIQSSEIKDKKGLMDARKLIEREMERFKVCEKETKTKAFSKEGLGQQPKTDPKEKAKTETRDWLNNVVGDLESQIDNFEAEVEGLSVKKGKTRSLRLTHLESSIARHKAHILKLELLLRLLDNDELSPDQVNDVKDFLEDYVERNQEYSEEFDDVDELYSTLPLDKVEALEDLVTIVPSSLVKTSSPTTQLNAAQDQSEETASPDSHSDILPKTPPSKIGAMGTPAGSNSVATANNVPRSSIGGPTTATILPVSPTIRGVAENSAASASVSSLLNPSGSGEEDNISFPVRRSSPAVPEIGGRGICKDLSTQADPVSLSSGLVPTVENVARKNLLSIDERTGSGLAQPLVSPLGSRVALQQAARTNEGNGLNDSNTASEGAPIGGSLFPPSVIPGVQWRPPVSFQNQNESSQFRGRPEISPNQREVYLQRFQQVQQQGHSGLLSVPHLPGANHKQFTSQSQNLLQQLNLQSLSLSSQVGVGHNVPTPGLPSVTSTSQQQQPSTHQHTSQHPVEEQQRQNMSDDLNGEPLASTPINKFISDDELKAPYTVTDSTSMMDNSQLGRDIDLSPGQPLQPGQPSGLGVIGRKSVSDLGTIGDNLSGLVGNSGGLHDQMYNMKMLEAAYRVLPQPKDSERVKNYVPRRPAMTPASYPQTQAPIVENPAFWAHLGLEASETDTLFFAFYYQQNTYQQYLAAKALKKQSWRYHRKYNTWFQRHEEPKVTNDEYEKGTYVYFDFHIADDGSQHGWCQRIKTEFTFEYNYLEDELDS